MQRLVFFNMDEQLQHIQDLLHRSFESCIDEKKSIMHVALLQDAPCALSHDYCDDSSVACIPFLDICFAFRQHTLLFNVSVLVGVIL